MGIVALYCANCHTAFSSTELIDARVEQAIFLPLMKPDKESDITRYDTHPVIHTGASTYTVENTNTLIDASGWPYMSAWYNEGKQGIRDIECTSCHNVHDWNQANDSTSRRNFLRRAWFDPDGPKDSKN